VTFYRGFRPASRLPVIQLTVHPADAFDVVDSVNEKSELEFPVFNNIRPLNHEAYLIPTRPDPRSASLSYARLIFLVETAA
jgi:hypothetical protein